VDVEPEIRFVVPLGASRGEFAVPNKRLIPMNSDDNATRQTNPAEPPLVSNNQLTPFENKLFRKWR
jgi:hypothetical protein